LYALGLSRYAEIYLGLEEVWHAKRTENISDESQSGESDKKRLQEVLRMIYLPELLRTERFRNDFAALKSQYKSIRDLDTDTANAGSEFRQYINDHISGNPHLLVVYVWIMYQALFNGGRFIRGKLLKADPTFWGWPEEEMDPTALPVPLPFWCIEKNGVEKDADVEAKFRKQVIEAEKLLTEHERKDILDEAPKILLRCKGITEQLEEEVGVGKSQQSNGV
jgi:hypothetical protein